MKAANSTSGPLSLGGSLGFKKIAQMIIVPPKTPPRTCIVLPNPIVGIRLSAMAGYMRPPIAVSAVARPIASDRFVGKYADLRAMDWMRTSPSPMPTRLR